MVYGHLSAARAAPASGTDAMDALLGMPTPEKASESGPDAMDRLLSAPTSATRPTTPGKAHTPVHAAAATRFQQARTAPTPSEPELSWGEIGKQAVHNFLPSLGGVGKSMADAVTHPVQTLTGLRDLGAGALSQGAGAIGLQQDPARKAQTERVVRALEDHYKQPRS